MTGDAPRGARHGILRIPRSVRLARIRVYQAFHEGSPSSLEYTMAEFSDRFDDNVAGRYYIDSSCIVCGACEGAAPDNIRLSDDGSHDLVYKQPVNADEEQALRDALDGCPVGAIGDDGQ